MANDGCTYRGVDAGPSMIRGWRNKKACSRKAVKDGFCAQHHPDAVKERQEEQRRRDELKWAQQNVERSIEHQSRRVVNVLLREVRGTISPVIDKEIEELRDLRKKAKALGLWGYGDES